MLRKKASSKYQLDRSRSARSERQTAAALDSSSDDEAEQLLTSKKNSQENNSDSDDQSDAPENEDDSDSDSSAGPSQNPSHRSATRSKAVMDEDEDESENEDSESGSEEEEPSPPRSRRAAAGSKRPTRGRKASSSKDDDDDDVLEFDASSSDEAFDEEEEEEVKPKRSSRQRKRIVTKKSAPSRRGRGKASNQKTDLSDSSEEEEEHTTPRSKRQSAARKKSSGSVTTPHTRSTRNDKKAAPYPQDSLAGLPSPKRSSAVKARNKVRDVSQIEEKGSDQDIDSDEASEEESDFEEEPAPKRNNNRGRGKASKKRKAAGSSDEEFQADSESDSSGDSSLSDAMDDDDDEIAKKSDASYQEENEDDDDDDMALDENPKAVNIDDEQVGTADESSGDEDASSSPKRPINGRKNEIRPSPRKGTFEHSEPSDSEDDDEGGKAANGNESRPRLPHCPSEMDAITSEELPERHVCYISPDGQSRQCFKLETLRQIALQSTQLALRNNLDGSQVQNFLQPPHFRTPASDDLLDQIASRFGRDALDLHGAYYKEKERREKLQEDSSDEDSDDEDVYALSTLQNSMQRYLNKTMGTSDLYACPLCYNQAYRKSNPPSDEEEGEAVVSEFAFDPMDVLGSLDQQEFEIAAQFCFSKAADVKKHLKSAHNIDPRGVQGNDLYARYKIRTPDGLLQRWLANAMNGARQGSMREYWNEGNNQSFILLLDLAKRARASPDKDNAPEDESEDHEDSDSDDEEAKTYREKAQEFWDSFAADAPSMWKALSEPFERENENMKNFIARDEDVEEDSEDEVANHAELHRQWAVKEGEADQNDFVHKLERQYVEDEGKGKKKGKKNDETSDSSEEEEELEIVDENDMAEEEGSDDDEEDEEELVKKRGYYSPVEEETDDWMLNRMDRKKRKSTPPSSNPSESATKRKAVVSATPVKGKKIRRKSESSTSKTRIAPIQLSASKRTPAIKDDSDDED